MQNEGNLVDPDHYCPHQEGWKEWDILVRKYPNDRDLQILHAQRIGLCTKIDQGSIRLEDAIDIFEQAHQRVIEKAKQERETDKKPSL